jgi:hypothetical protein
MFLGKDLCMLIPHLYYSFNQPRSLVDTLANVLNKQLINLLGAALRKLDVIL